MIIIAEFGREIKQERWILDRKKKNSKSKDLEFMARSGGFEPTTYRFVAGHSIH